MTNTSHIMQRDARSGSFEAAVRQTKGKRAELYARIMHHLTEAGPLTDEQLLGHIYQLDRKPATPSGVRSRRNELVLAGWVTELRDDYGAPVKKRNANGSPCQVWRAVEPSEACGQPRPKGHRRSAPDHTTPAVLKVLAEHGPLTQEQVHAHYMAAGYPPKSRQRINTVVSDLVKKGDVIESLFTDSSARGYRSKMFLLPGMSDKPAAYRIHADDFERILGELRADLEVFGDLIDREMQPERYQRLDAILNGFAQAVTRNV